MRALPADPAAAPLLTRINAGEISAAPPVTTPAGLVTTDELAGTVPAPPPALPGWLLALERAIGPLRWLLAAFALAAAVVGVALLVAGGAAGVAVGVVLLVLAAAAAAVAVAVAVAVARAKPRPSPADSLRPAALTVAAIDRLPAFAR